MELQSARLILKEICWEDLDAIHNLYSLPEVDEFNTLGIPKDIGETRKNISPAIEAQKDENRKSYFWKIVKKDSEEFIGVAGLSLSLNRFKLGEIFYSLLPGFWGKGFATEVAKTLVKSGFEDFNLHKVEAGVATGNTRSIKVLEKAGMTREGLRRKILPIRGEWKDNFHYAIVEDDPRDY
ncbi:GNAT family N-acetyltransferase [Maribellus sediminis]|uniref:GNAT family N-acetyltransferase n=1 Tax=Maribellus sediminis TaxID=2696285 RepID=UPI00143211F1|nr:GNAT family N-acetyltransferase [Maribellus sediminis]